MRLSALVLCGSLAGCVAAEGDESFIILNNLVPDPVTGVCTPSRTGASFSSLFVGFTDVTANVCSLFESRVVAAEGKESLRTILIEGADIRIEVGQIFIENPLDGTVETRGAEETRDVTVQFSSSLPPNGGIAAGIYDVVPIDVMADIRAATIDVNNDPTLSVRVEVKTTATAFGDFYGDRIESTSFQFPVIVNKPATCNINPTFSCDPAFGEDTTTCPADCFCGDLVCNPIDEDITSCPADCACGNGVCETGLGETVANCPSDCTCGNNICEPARGEDMTTCPNDCVAP
jgi:hypothetical protein